MTFRRSAATRSSPFGSRILGSEHQSTRALRIRVQLLLTALLITTNLIGAALVIVVSLFVAPAPGLNRANALALIISIPTYAGVAVLVTGIIGTKTGLRALHWIRDGTEPTEEDRRRALLVPLHLTQIQGWTWFGATVYFTVQALILQPERALTTAVNLAIAAVVGCAVAYQLTEWALRPVTARALSGAPLAKRNRGAGVGGRMVIFWSLGTAAPIVGLVAAAIITLTDDEISKTSLAVISLVTSGVVLTFGLFITVMNARSVVAPVLTVRDALLDVERGDFDRSVQVFDGTEIGLLQSGFNEMAAGLREREHLRDMFGRHVGQEVAQAAATGEVSLGGETRTVSVLFVDLIGSTTYATEHSAEAVVGALNRFFGVVVDEVAAHHGLVNKFMGDAVLAIFGAPVELPDHADAALAAARIMADRLAREVPEVGAGIGIATGEVVAGNVGHQSRFEYTVIGDAVNSASRLTDLAKDVPSRILAMAATVEVASAEEAKHWEPAGSRTLRGRDEATPVATLSKAQPSEATAAS